MPRIFLPIERHSDTIHITGEKARYLATVLRCREGDEVQIFDGSGFSYSAKISGITRKEVVVDVLEVTQCDTESPVNLILIQGVLKGEKMDLVIQKTTELGVKAIIPAVMERGQVRDTKKISRWRKIAEDASRQCCRSDVPVIHDLLPFKEIFSQASQYMQENEIHPLSPPLPQRKGTRGRVKDLSSDKIKGILFWEERGSGITEVIDRVKGCDSLMFAVGPEGGFTGKEVSRAESGGFLIASLGSRILRAETAAITATALLQFVMGGLG